MVFSLSKFAEFGEGQGGAPLSEFAEFEIERKSGHKKCPDRVD
jgi:hypothetical protein